jgi:hypothetical protein
MTYKKEVIDTAIAAMKTGGYAEAESFRTIFDRIYDSGYNEAVRTLHQFEYNKPVPPLHSRGCHICGIGANGEIMGYVCHNSSCPTKITC